MIEEQIAIVQAYIFHRKDVDVIIARPITLNQVLLLNKAHRIALNWFSVNGSIKYL